MPFAMLNKHLAKMATIKDTFIDNVSKCLLVEKIKPNDGIIFDYFTQFLILFEQNVCQ